MLPQAILTLCAIARVYGAEPHPARPPPQGPPRQVILPARLSYSPDFQYNVNLLEPQLQYPGYDPRVQPPVLVYGAAPGQQFLVRPGAPPGNFLIPQPQPQPGVYYGANPQGPVYVAGYPKPAHVPPIEKDAEEVPGLAGNHPATATGRPLYRPTLEDKPEIRRPEKLETLDEPLIPVAGDGDAGNPLPGDKTVPGFPKKPFPARPALRPGQRFFILNGQPIYQNYPLDGTSGAPPASPTLHQSNPDIYLYRQPQYLAEPQPVDTLPEFVVRNSGQFSNARGYPQDGSYVALNQPSDFRQNIFVKHQVPFAQQSLPNALSRDYSLVPLFIKGAPLKADEGRPAKLRLGKDVIIHPHQRFLLNPLYTPNAFALDGYGDDDSIVIDAKSQSDASESQATDSAPSDEPPLSQAQPSAIALAGKGGVASAGPKGTALTGDKGLAVAQPQATAIAGPSKEDDDPKPQSKKGRN